MTKKKNPRKPNIRQRKYVAEKLKGKSSSQAARDAGYSEATALGASTELDNNNTVKRLIQDSLRRAGISDELIAKRIRERLDARETKFFQKDGKVTATRNVIDHAQRGAATDVVLKLFGHLVDKHEIVGKLTLEDLLDDVNADK